LLVRGGLFEYGTDGEIESTLKILRKFSEVLAVIGSVTRADEPIRKLRETRRSGNLSSQVSGIPQPSQADWLDYRTRD
jgi:hypothetical protein